MARRIILFIKSKLYLFLPLCLLFCFHGKVCPQKLEVILSSSGKGLLVDSALLSSDLRLKFPEGLPLFSLEINNRLISSAALSVMKNGDGTWMFVFPNGMTGKLSRPEDHATGWKVMLIFTNPTSDTLRLSNVVPFGVTNKHIFITAAGPGGLARTRLFRPGLGPVGVIVPDNAWEMGYASVPLAGDISVCALARRSEVIDGERRRYETLLPPRSSVSYTFYMESFGGAWQNGLKRMFQERYLYDLDKFDSYLYEREDLKWIRHKYIVFLQFAWNKEFYNAETGKYMIYDYLERGKQLFGGIDIYGLWPTWPRLGVDQRNQWDLYRDLPYGLEKLREISSYAKQNGTRFYIAYNPWDQSTRPENPYAAMASIIKEVDADGVVLDTRGSSSAELQRAADSVRQGVIMYSEGMAVPRDMPGIISGRVHDAIFMPPPLNLNKLIRPDHAIFRVCQLSEGRLHREIAVSFFNGTGIEINTFAPGRPGWIEEDFRYMGETTMLLRANSSVFTNKLWTPLVESRQDSIWINSWTNGEKIIYTVYSLRPKGYSGPLIPVDQTGPWHYVSLWNHTEIKPVQIDDRLYLPVDITSFNKSYLGTRQEGQVECIAAFPDLLRYERKGDSLFFQATTGDRIRLWKGKPSYQGEYLDFPVGFWELKLFEKFGRYTGDYILQLYEEDELLDQRVISFEPGKPWLISSVEKTRLTNRPPADMTEISAGEFDFSVSNEAGFIPYPDYSTPVRMRMNRYFMDRYPVTNRQYFEFLAGSGYLPKDPENFLKHWKDGSYPPGQEDYPVVWVSLEDARAYASWTGKRLPSEIEWQYAAQGSDKRIWPWGDEFFGTRCNNAFDRPTPVDAFRKGASPFGVIDMVGNVWQITNDVYDNGTYTFGIIRGGSFFKPTSSWWYVEGGPQPLNRTQMLLQVSPGFDRNATVGFRCVMDAQPKDEP